MNLINKIWQFFCRKNKIHPFSNVSCLDGKLLMIDSTINLGCEIHVNGGTLQLSGVWLDRFVRLETHSCLSIGKGTTINMCSKIYGDVFIGEDCLIAPNVFMSSTVHVFDLYKGMSIRDQEKNYLKSHDSLPSKPIKIGNDVWLAANTVILPGVSICSHVVIGANSVVNKTIEEPGVYAGSPARKVRDL
jgi:acetyltransferase-like isoleucine patch superfamily enzyme